MAEITTSEQLRQRALDMSVVDHAQLQGGCGVSWIDDGAAGRVSASASCARIAYTVSTRTVDAAGDAGNTGFFYGDYKVLYCAAPEPFCARVSRGASHNGKMYAVKVLRSSLSNPKGTHPKDGKSLEVGRLSCFAGKARIGLRSSTRTIVRDS